MEELILKGIVLFLLIVGYIVILFLIGQGIRHVYICYKENKDRINKDTINIDKYSYYSLLSANKELGEIRAEEHRGKLLVTLKDKIEKLDYYYNDYNYGACLAILRKIHFKSGLLDEDNKTYIEVRMYEIREQIKELEGDK